MLKSQVRHDVPRKKILISREAFRYTPSSAHVLNYNLVLSFAKRGSESTGKNTHNRISVLPAYHTLRS